MLPLGFSVKKDCTDAPNNQIDTIPVVTKKLPISSAALVKKAEEFSPKNLWDRVRVGLEYNSYSTNEQIEKEILSLTSNKTSLQQISNRAVWYLYHIVEEIDKRNLPMELAFMPIVESSLDSQATSPAGAGGLWQIMPYTGEHLGLSKNKWYDGRYDIIEATNVALNYMETLYATFGDWELAFAAFNSGPSRVKSAITKNRLSEKPVTFWDLNLPKETHNYVARIIALSTILKHHKKYEINFGFLHNSPSIAYIDINHHIDLKEIARESATAINTLIKINPGLLKQITPPNISYKLVVPVAKKHIVINKINSNLIQDIYAKSNKYTVNKNDTLIQIAQKFNTTTTRLKELNKLNTDTIIVGKKLLIPQANKANTEVALAKSNSSKQPTITKGKYYHEIKRGDNLSKIALKYQVNISDLKSWNKSAVNSKYLKIGQKLLIYR